MPSDNVHEPQLAAAHPRDAVAVDSPQPLVPVLEVDEHLPVRSGRPTKLRCGMGATGLQTRNPRVRSAHQSFLS